MLDNKGVCQECFREFDLEWEAETFGERGLKKGSKCPDEDCPSNE
ncbi:hypothetical protein [Vibrio alginolyticus]|nr:hypothetical protein [Vibrio alginolyticus]